MEASDSHHDPATLLPINSSVIAASLPAPRSEVPAVTTATTPVPKSSKGCFRNVSRRARA